MPSLKAYSIQTHLRSLIPEIPKLFNAGKSSPSSMGTSCFGKGERVRKIQYLCLSNTFFRRKICPMRALICFAFCSTSVSLRTKAYQSTCGYTLRNHVSVTHIITAFVASCILLFFHPGREYIFALGSIFLKVYLYHVTLAFLHSMRWLTL